MSKQNQRRKNPRRRGPGRQPRHLNKACLKDELHTGMRAADRQTVERARKGDEDADADAPKRKHDVSSRWNWD